MNIHTTRTFTLTSLVTPDGEDLALDTLPAHAALLTSQCSVQGTLPVGVTLAVHAVPAPDASAPVAVVLRVAGGELPADVALSGVLSYVSAPL